MSSSCGVQVPYLALKHVAGSDKPVFFDFMENKAMDIQHDGGGGVAELTNGNCWATPQGWVLVRSSSSTYLLDPHSHCKIQLPHLPDEGQSTYCTCVLSDYPDPAEPSSSCIVLLVETDTPVIWYCHAGGGEDQEWVKHEFDIGTLHLGDGCTEKLVISPIAACRGKFYFNCDFKEMGVLEFCPMPVFSSITIPDRPVAHQPKGVMGRQYMVESKQELYVVSLLSGYDLDVVHRFHVHKMDFSKLEWREVRDIGDQTFLLSSWYFGASRPAEENELDRNCVYMACPWKKRFVILNVGDGSIEVEEFDQAPASDQALWMLPTTHS
ncbi:hypothetical protein ACP70R_005030 [Stipagrostis hirtigluma subsp. patula]